MPSMPLKWSRPQSPRCPKRATASAGPRWPTRSLRTARPSPARPERNWILSLANISLDDPAAARAWFTGTVEPLADSFEPANVDRYVQLFAEVIERVNPLLQVGEV